MTGQPTQRTKPTIGLTGGIASGKSTVARFLQREGAAIVDADQIAREVVEPGSEGLAAVIAAFGHDLLAPDGSLHRERLAAIVFDDAGARLRLQAILHPRIAQRSGERIEELRQSDASYVVYEAPLLVETGAHKALDALIVVAAGEEAQVARAVERDGSGRDLVTRRIAAQLPLARKLEVADYVIWNDAGLEQLEQRTMETHDRVLLRFGLGKGSA